MDRKGDEMNQKTKRILKITCMVCFIILIPFVFNEVFAQINPNNSSNEGLDELKNTFAYILQIAMGPLTFGLVTFINAILLVIFIVLYVCFSPISSGFGFPFPDQIVFNKLAFFDPNFINPPTYENGGAISTSPVVIVGDVISNMYYTCFIIAAAVFIVCAMIIGIKLAISTIASDKAHYKEALVMWVSSLCILVFAHFIMLGIFTVNEAIVNECSKIVDNNIEFKLNPFQDLGGKLGAVGKSVSGIIGFFTEKSGMNNPVDQAEFSLKGYAGMLMFFLIKAVSGDLVSSIICGILLGQTVALIAQYLRRLFYCIILGILAPLVVAADVVKKSISV